MRIDLHDSEYWPFNDIPLDCGTRCSCSLDGGQFCLCSRPRSWPRKPRRSGHPYAVRSWAVPFATNWEHPLQSRLLDLGATLAIPSMTGVIRQSVVQPHLSPQMVLLYTCRFPNHPVEADLSFGTGLYLYLTLSCA